MRARRSFLAMNLTLEQLLQVGGELRSLHPAATLPRIDHAIIVLCRAVEGGLASRDVLRANVVAVVRTFVSSPRARVHAADEPSRRPTTLSTRLVRP